MPARPPLHVLETQMDLLEHAALTDVVVPAVVLEEVRARNQSVFQRLKALTTNDAKRFYVFANENHKYAAVFCFLVAFGWLKGGEAD